MLNNIDAVSRKKSDNPTDKQESLTYRLRLPGKTSWNLFLSIKNMFNEKQVMQVPIYDILKRVVYLLNVFTKPVGQQPFLTQNNKTNVSGKTTTIISTNS